MGFAQNLKALFQSIRTAPLPTEPVRMRVRRGLLDRVQTQQVQSLLGPVGQGGNAERSSLAVAFQDVHASQRLRSITASPQRVEGRGFGLRSVPDVAVHSRSTRTSIANHS